MSALVRALRAEALKLRHSLAAWLVLLAPLVIIVLALVQFSFATIRHPHQFSPAEAWLRFSAGMFVLWSFLMLPLLVTLLAALLANMEHANQQWKHLLALPVPRWSHYAAKFCVLAAMVVSSTLLLGVMTPLAGWIVMHTQPAYGMAGPPPWGWLATHTLACIAAAGLMVALQAWVALRWHSFTTALFVGISATVCGFMIGQSPRFGHWYPWSMPLQVFARPDTFIAFVVIAGLGGGLLVALLALWDVQRREQA
jgi:ABC-2 type transport system permease protein